MNREWDRDKGGKADWIQWMQSVADQCLRVIKPGGHALVWAIPRTSHWTGTAWEDAGWQPRDKIYHIFGSGFPKSLDISKAIDKAAGAEREVVRTAKGAGSSNTESLGVFRQEYMVTAPATEAAKQWEGWGTALKPAAEEWWLFRKPLIGTVAANVLEHGTGGLNIDGCRVETNPEVDDPRLGGKGDWSSDKMAKNVYEGGYAGDRVGSSPLGRFPANFILTYPEDSYKLRDNVSLEQLKQLLDWMHENHKH
jgi:site-specific DNA-methyltransferase (adenine-specific)